MLYIMVNRKNGKVQEQLNTAPNVTESLIDFQNLNRIKVLGKKIRETLEIKNAKCSDKNVLNREDGTIPNKHRHHFHQDNRKLSQQKDLTMNFTACLLQI